MHKENDNLKSKLRKIEVDLTRKLLEIEIKQSENNHLNNRIKLQNKEIEKLMK